MKGLLPLLENDFRRLWRAKHMLAAVFGFSLLLVVVSSFAFRRVGYGVQELRDLSPGILWLIFLFSGVVGLNYTATADRENEALAGVLLSPVDRSAVYFSRFLSSTIFLCVVQVFAVCAHELFFGAELFHRIPMLVMITVLVSIGFVSLGTLLSAMTAVIKERDILLPLLLFPFSLPLLAGAVFVTRSIIESGAVNYSGFWFMLIVVFDVVSLVLSWNLFDYVVGD